MCGRGQSGQTRGQHYLRVNSQKDAHMSPTEPETGVPLCLADGDILSRELHSRCKWFAQK